MSRDRCDRSPTSTTSLPPASWQALHLSSNSLRTLTSRSAAFLLPAAPPLLAEGPGAGAAAGAGAVVGLRPAIHSLSTFFCAAGSESPGGIASPAMPLVPMTLA
ncbi:hypothetical protein [Nannocystis pusilla]|uniref:hypothetical protein n=1 Tax=Nannocystis pusilla TaxID=889268 RepID=UPI003DA52724